jgi:hypothetical protein
MTNEQDKPVNPFNSSVDPELSAIFNQLVNLKTRVNDQLNKAERMAGFGENSRFIPLTKITVNLPSILSIREPNSNGFYKRKVPIEQVEKIVRKHIAIARATIAEIEEQNKPAIEHNANLCKQIGDLMSRIGIQSSYTTYELPSPRHKNRQHVYRSAGYLGDLQRTCPQSNAWSEKQKVDDHERRLEHYIQTWKVEETKEKASSDARAIEKFISSKPHTVSLLTRAADIDLLTRLSTAEPGQKYDVIKESIDEAISVVLKKDKYTCLAYFLEQNRNDWNDGFSFAKQGLDMFIDQHHGTDENFERDLEIIDEIQELISNWDGDGRVFRDCRWNYNVIYSLSSDPSLTDILRELNALLN